MLVVRAEVLRPCRVHLLADPGLELRRLPQVLVQLDRLDQLVPPRLGRVLEAAELPGQPVVPGLDGLAVGVAGADQLGRRAAVLVDDARVGVDLQLQRLVLGQQLDGRVLVLAVVGGLERLD